MIQYQVIINRIDTEAYADKEYQKIADSGNLRDGGAIYDYVSGNERLRTETVNIYSQTVEKLDIVRVIGSVNNVDPRLTVKQNYPVEIPI